MNLQLSSLMIEHSQGEKILVGVGCRNQNLALIKKGKHFELEFQGWQLNLSESLLHLAKIIDQSKNVITDTIKQTFEKMDGGESYFRRLVNRAERLRASKQRASFNFGK